MAETFVDVPAANRRHDAEHGDPFLYQAARVRPGWTDAMFLRGEKLTDRKISRYEERGFYSGEVRDARRELAKKRAAKRSERDGHFDVVGGRMIYRP